MERRIINYVIVLIFLSVFLIPFPLTKILYYQITSVHIILVLFVYAFLSGFYFFVGNSFWRNFITQYVWFLRGLALLTFLLATLRLGITKTSLVSFLGTIGLTFFYEFWYFLTTLITSKSVLRLQVWVWALSALITFIIIAPFLMSVGIVGLLYEVNVIRQHIPDWPNYFAVHMFESAAKPHLPLFYGIIILKKLTAA